MALRPPFPPPLRLWAEDRLLRFPSSSPVSDFGPVVVALRHPQALSPLPVRELLGWLAGGRPPLLVRAGLRWLEFHRPLHSTFGSNLLLWLLGRWVPALLRRDLPLRVRFGSGGGVVVLRNWGELNLPLARDYFGLRLAVRFSLPRLSPLLLTLFRIRP